MAAGVALVFVISLMSVTLIELVGDRPLSGESSGSARHLARGGPASDDGGDDDDDGGDTDGGDPNVPPATAPADATTTTRPGSDGTPTTTTAGSSGRLRCPDGADADVDHDERAARHHHDRRRRTSPGTTTVPVPTTAAPPPAGRAPARSPGRGDVTAVDPVSARGQRRGVRPVTGDT